MHGHLQQRVDGHAEGHRQRAAGGVPPGVQHADDGAVAAGRPARRSILVLAPMYHVNAFATLHNLLAGDRLVVLEQFDAARAVDAIERHRVTTFTATPTMLQRIADLPGIDDRDLSSIDWFLQGAAPMPPSLVHRWVGLIGRRADPHGLRHDRGHRHHRAAAATSGWPTRAASAAASAAPRSGSSTRPARAAGRRDRRDLHARARPTAARPTSATRRSCGPPTTASRPWATWATSTTTATSTSSTAGST